MEQTQCSYEKLMYDEACVVIKNSLEISESWLYSLSSDCHSCSYTRIAQTTNAENQSITFNTARSLTWILKSSGEDEYTSASNTSNKICEISPDLGQFGLYELIVSNGSCRLNTVEEPSSLYNPLLIIFGAILCLLIGISLLRYGTFILRKRLRKQSVAQVVEKSSIKRRVKSIDTFRGISILFMIFVNDGAGGYVILEHATWDGLLIGDLVFPWFMWIMGVCIPISVASQLSRHVSRLSICKAIIKRSVILFLLGVSLNTLGTDAQLENIRIFGVLQRFSIVYFVVATTVTLLIKRKMIEPENAFLETVSDILELLPQWVLICGIVVVHCAITFCLPVPGCPTGYLGPGGRHEGGKYSECIGGATGYIDRMILGVNHIYQWPKTVAVYGSGPFDPEGIFGCLSSIFQVFLGVQAGIILRYHKEWKNRVTRWLGWAAVCGCVGAILHFTDTIPINKNLWSLSFVLVTTCFAFILLTLCYLLIDVLEVWRGGPFRIPGMNALVMYVGHQLCFQIFPFHWRYGPMNTHAWRLAESLLGVVLWTAIAYVLHWKKIYVSL